MYVHLYKQYSLWTGIEFPAGEQRLPFTILNTLVKPANRPKNKVKFVFSVYEKQ